MLVQFNFNDEFSNQFEFPDNSSYEELQAKYDAYVLDMNNGYWEIYDEEEEDFISSEIFKTDGVQIRMELMED
jgi:hypothetical protein